MGIYFFITILVITVAYSYYQTKNFVQGPILKIESPLNGSLIKTKLITIKGYTENISYISINNRQTFVDENGYLNERLLLSPGYNIIRISAKDKYQREVEEKLELVYR